MTTDESQMQIDQCDNERDVQWIVANWLASNGFEVFWDRNPPDEYQRFKVSNSPELPDLVAVGEEDIVVIEMKDGDESAAVYDAMSQAHRYWRYVEQDEKDLLLGEEKTRTPTAVTIATQYSPLGHLFKHDREQGWRKTYERDDGWWNRGMRPQYEYGRTEAIPRIMWRYA